MLPDTFPRPGPAFNSNSNFWESDKKGSFKIFLKNKDFEIFVELFEIQVGHIPAPWSGF